MKKNEIILFETADNEVSLQVQVEDESVWLTQTQMIELFGRDQSVISRHINNVFKEGEVDKESNMHFLQIANADRRSFYEKECERSGWSDFFPMRCYN